jgi:hypothetical protein
MLELDERPDVDFDLLFGEMPEIPCEGPKHGKSKTHGNGPGTDYWQMMHDCWVPAGTIYILCEGKTRSMFEDIERANSGGYTKVSCPCGTIVDLYDGWVKYVGPVGK